MIARTCLLIAACGFALAGCGAPSKQGRSDARASAPSTATTNPVPASSKGRLTLNDPCPSRLHDLCGPLIYYVRTKYRWPEMLDELRAMPGGEALGEFACPTSKQPYVYDPSGVVGANTSERAVVYDATPSHAGRRWAIVVKEATPDGPAIARVDEWPESRFPTGIKSP